MDPSTIAVLSGLVTGGALVAVIEGIKEAFAWRRNRKAQLEDRADDRVKEIEELKEAFAGLAESQKEMKTAIDALITATRIQMLDRIQHLGLAYIARGDVSYEERKTLHEMHDSYHYGLGGNGDADLIIEAVDELPLK